MNSAGHEVFRQLPHAAGHAAPAHRECRRCSDLGDQRHLAGLVFARDDDAVRYQRHRRAAPPRSRRARCGCRGSSAASSARPGVQQLAVGQAPREVARVRSSSRISDARTRSTVTATCPVIARREVRAHQPDLPTPRRRLPALIEQHARRCPAPADRSAAAGPAPACRGRRSTAAPCVLSVSPRPLTNTRAAPEADLEELEVAAPRLLAAEHHEPDVARGPARRSPGRRTGGGTPSASGAAA